MTLIMPATGNEAIRAYRNGSVPDATGAAAPAERSRRGGELTVHASRESPPVVSTHEGPHAGTFLKIDLPDVSGFFGCERPVRVRIEMKQQTDASVYLSPATARQIRDELSRALDALEPTR